MPVFFDLHPFLPGVAAATAGDAYSSAFDDIQPKHLPGMNQRGFGDVDAAQHTGYFPNPLIFLQPVDTGDGFIFHGLFADKQVLVPLRSDLRLMGHHQNQSLYYGS